MPVMERGSVSDSRRERARRAHELRHGTPPMTAAEIAGVLGISRSYAAELLADPDGSESRRRKERYRLPCPNQCGNLMTGSDGISGAPKLCAACTAELQHETRYWTRETIIEQLRLFHKTFGRSPSASDVLGRSTSGQKKCSAERIVEIEAARSFSLPVPWTVAREFGGWQNALEAAGLPANPIGGNAHRTVHHRLSGSAIETLALIVDGSTSLQALAISRRRNIRTIHVLVQRLVSRGLVVETDRGSYEATPAGIDHINQSGGSLMPRMFVVLQQTEEGWARKEIVEALNKNLAIEKAADSAGVFVAVPEEHWQELPVGPVTKLAVIVVEQPKAA